MNLGRNVAVRRHRGGVGRAATVVLFATLVSYAARADQTVQVGPDLTFSPATVTVSPGETVTWQFQALHTTTSDSQSGPETWDSGVLTSGQSFSHTFSTPGSYPYYCAIHSVPGGTMMNGVVMVSGGVTATPTLPAPTPTTTPTTIASTTPTLTPTTTPTTILVTTPTTTPVASPTPAPSGTPLPGAPATGVPDLGSVGRAILAIALAAAGIAALYLLQRR